MLLPSAALERKKKKNFGLELVRLLSSDGGQQTAYYNPKVNNGELMLTSSMMTRALGFHFVFGTIFRIPKNQKDPNKKLII